ncbi:MAG TPA: EAL domain-containing protein [Noviherbaspirillum sp.]|nr:EAL domain-containing protein [Noviherbaspirillum sp.]
MEALIRWLPKEQRAIGPAEFIPIAETSGLINSLGEWVMCEACRQHETWRSEGWPTLRIAVNVSPVEFRSKDFLVQVQRLVHDSGIDPTCLELELTEGMIMRHVEEASKTIGKLKDLGVRISLDDFGTGYSSLSHLSMLPIDKIKVDRSFIYNIERSDRSLAIIEAMIVLAKKLGVQVVAEGIKSSDALDLLRDRGCDLGQGYLLSKPLPVTSVSGWIKSQHGH